MRERLAGLIAILLGGAAGGLIYLIFESRTLTAAIGIATAYLAHGELLDLLGARKREPVPPGTPLMENPVFRRRVFGVLILGVAASLILREIFTGDVEVEQVRDWIRDLGPWGPVLLIVSLAAAMVFAPIPNPPFMIAAGIAWGTPLGVAYSVAGQTLGSAIIFVISRKAGRRFIPRLIGQSAAERVDVMAASMGPHLVFWWRMMPVAFDFAAYAAGLTAMRFRTFITLVIFGSIIPTTVVVSFGDSFDSSWTARAVSAGIIAVAIAVPATIFFIKYRSEIPALQSLLTGAPAGGAGPTDSQPPSSTDR